MLMVVSICGRRKWARSCTEGLAKSTSTTAHRVRGVIGIVTKSKILVFHIKMKITEITALCQKFGIFGSGLSAR